MNKLMVGSDPEFAVVDSENKVVPVPYFMYDLGINPIYWDESKEARLNKKYYHPVILQSDKFKAIMDGVAFEFTLPPVDINNPEEMFKNVSEGLQSVKNFANKYGFNLSTKPSLKYDFYKYYQEGNELKEWCGIFGCDRDKDAIDTEYNSPDLDVRNHEWRYFGGHIHVSDNNILIKEYPEVMIKLMAICVGNMCNFLSPYREEERLRTFKYGQPGRYRIQNYPDGNIGVEYRSPSNYWTTNLTATRKVFEWVDYSYEFLKNPKEAIDLINKYLTLTVQALKTSDQDLSEEIISKISKYDIIKLQGEK